MLAGSTGSRSISPLADQPEGERRAGEAEQRAEREHVVDSGQESLARGVLELPC